MSEYIITDEQIAENRRLHGKKLLVMPVIVRCRDCVAYEPYHTYAGMKLDYGECTQHRRQTDDDRGCISSLRLIAPYLY